jgi:hypothetical protein
MTTDMVRKKKTWRERYTSILSGGVSSFRSGTRSIGMPILVCS